MDYISAVPAGPPDLTVVIPTYNERDRLDELATALFREADARQVVLEAVIVDDNSPDGTGAIADRLAQRYRVKAVHRAGKLGLGTAVMEGFRAASADVVAVMDADFSHPPHTLPDLFHAFRTTGADMVIASRYIPGGATPGWPIRRLMMSRLACVLTRGLSPVKDSTSGFFLIHRQIAQATTVNAGGFKICLELMCRSGARNIVEFPYWFEDRQQGASKMTLREGLGYLVQLGKLYLARLRSGRPKQTYQRIAPPAHAKPSNA
jgi:dolichol-phosphate mannosyltransferase